MADPYASKKDKMLELLQKRGIRDPRILNSMREIPRHQFVPLELEAHAHEDRPLGIGYGQTISQPYMAAYMTQALELSGLERVLEIGTGSGYQTALLAKICREVYTVEIIPELSLRARKMLESLQLGQIFFRVGDGHLGWREAAPFDRIVITAATPRRPEALLGQLGEGGSCVFPMGTQAGPVKQKLYRARKQASEISCEELIPVLFVPMISETP